MPRDSAETSFHRAWLVLSQRAMAVRLCRPPALPCPACESIITRADAFPHVLPQDKRLIAALDLVRRMPPAHIEQTLEGVRPPCVPRSRAAELTPCHAPSSQSWSISCLT